MYYCTYRVRSKARSIQTVLLNVNPYKHALHLHRHTVRKCARSIPQHAYSTISSQHLCLVGQTHAVNHLIRFETWTGNEAGSRVEHETLYAELPDAIQPCIMSIGELETEGLEVSLACW